MRIEDIRRWHWMLIAIAVGLLMSYLKADPDHLGVRRTVERLRFEGEVMAAPRAGNPVVRNIVVHPPYSTGVQVTTSKGKQTKWVALVTFEWLRPTEDPKVWKYEQWAYNSDATETQEGPPTVLTRLEQLKKMRPEVTYRFAWWEQPVYVYSIYTGGAILLMGIIWPTIQNKLVGAGYGRVSEPKKDRTWRRGARGRRPAVGYRIVFPWHWFRRGEPETSTPLSAYDSVTGGASGGAKPSKVTDEEFAAQLKQMEAGLKDFVAAGAAAAESDDGPVAPEVTAPVAKLQTTPLQPSAVAARNEPGQPESRKEYGGEFYPTVAHAPVHKKDGE